MATAKQIAARKLFVKRVRAGEFTKAKKRKSNPAKKKTVSRKGTSKIGRVSQITKRPPTKRLKARRAANSRPGYFPNPKPKADRAYRFKVQCSTGVASGFKTVATFADKERAFEYARALKKLKMYANRSVRVVM